MTTTQMTDTYLAHIGRRRLNGSGLMPILPFFILDAMYQIYRKDIAPLNLTHEAKRIRAQWIGQYNEFNRDFFMAFPQENWDEITDLMDDFCDYIHNDIEVFRVSVMNILPGTEVDAQRIIASSFACNILAQAAGIIWKDSYLNRSGKGVQNRYIHGIERMSYKFMNIIHGKTYHLDPNQNKAICDAVSVLSKKIVRWLNKSPATPATN